MCTLWRFHHAGDQRTLEGVEARRFGIQRQALLHLFGRNEALLGRSCEQVIEVGVGTGDQGVAETVGAVDVDEGDVQFQRGHRQQHLTVVIG
ncbi:hypothetical protein SSTU70S_03179 [Stutzerimonas stutzeri]